MNYCSFYSFFSKYEYIAKRSGLATFTSKGTTESINRTKEILFGSILGSKNFRKIPACYSTNGGNKLAPYFITGLADAESSFIISIYNSKERKTG
jgi:hypothetical protein